MNEFERIEALRARLAIADGESDVVVGIGDDAAVIQVPGGRQVVSVDCAAEGTHFRWGFGPADALMERAVTAALSDLAAMGARATAIVSALVLGPDVDDERFIALADGLANASQRYRVPVVGGNLSRGATTSFTTTVLGEPWEEPLLRSGARPGDGLFVTGPLGGTALGLHLLLAGAPIDPADAAFVAQWLRPTARLDLSAQLAQTATAAIDISDGLLQDLEHLCHASIVDAHIALERLPLHQGFAARATHHGCHALRMAASAGEAYEVVFCAPANTEPPWATRIGEMVQADGPGRVVASLHGSPLPHTSRGFSHFP